MHEQRRAAGVNELKAGMQVLRRRVAGPRKQQLPAHPEMRQQGVAPEVEPEELAASAYGLDAPPRDASRKILRTRQVSTQHPMAEGLDPFDRGTRGVGGKAAPDDLDFGQFRHSLAPGR
ncbi:hypothetical protein GCM10009811_27130 [Nostocoides veronense]|uniref:Uncharacterized protein n=1 Tax=Nostocoides veronense TaxID=330836 RepID=A0ABN2LX99_9MICO